MGKQKKKKEKFTINLKLKVASSINKHCQFVMINYWNIYFASKTQIKEHKGIQNTAVEGLTDCLKDQANQIHYTEKLKI